MYGKLFSSTFTGSLFGAGAEVFAVWAYVVANTVDSLVELNPALLSATLGVEPDKVRAAIERLCQPDKDSRNRDHEGRRLVHQSGFQYFVVSHDIYRGIRNEDDRRAYNRDAQRRSRERKKVPPVIDTSLTVNDSQQVSALSAHTEAEAEVQAEEKTPVPQVVPPAPRPDIAVPVSEKDIKRKEAWDAIVAVCEIPERRKTEYLRPCYIRTTNRTKDATVVEVNCPDTVKMRWIRDQYRVALSEAAAKAFPGSNFRFQFVCKPLSVRAAS
jgi:hypothetical protein